MLLSANARVGVRAHSGRALAQGLAAFARAGASSFVSKSVPTVARPQAASRLLSTTSTIKQHTKEENQAPPTHTSPPPLLSQESNAPAPANGGLALPLDGIRILDLTRVLAGPYCTQILGDLGAEVIKVENPKGGDDTRAWGPPFAGNQHDPADRGESAYFLSVNRNKKSITVNFRTKEGQAIIHDLAKRCDILVENYVPGKLQKYGLGYEQLKELNPKLIYASITGYGQTGPYATRPGYDCIIEAEAGLMHITGESTGPPVMVGVAVTDLTTGLYAHGAIMAALLARAKTGRGQHIDCSLMDSQLATLSDIGSSYLISGQEPHRWGASHPIIVPYQAFPTRDSRIMLSGGNDGQFKSLCRVLGLEHLPTDIRFRTNSDRVKHRDDLIKIMTERLQEHDIQHWLKAFEGQGVPYTAINDFAHTFAHPQVAAREMVQEVEHPKVGKLKLIGIPVKYSESKPSVRLPPPLLGQHTQEILRDVLHYDAEKVDSLATAGAI